MVRDIDCRSICAVVYDTVSWRSGIPLDMLTLSNGVQILRRNIQLHNYMSPGNLSHGPHSYMFCTYVPAMQFA